MEDLAPLDHSRATSQRGKMDRKVKNFETGTATRFWRPDVAEPGSLKTI